MHLQLFGHMPLSIDKDAQVIASLFSETQCTDIATDQCKQPMEHLTRRRLGEIPLLQMFIKRLKFREVLSHYLPSHGNESIPAVETLLLAVCNIACGRQPLYELPGWIDQLDHRALGKPNPNGYCGFNDDRFGRALDKLFKSDRASLITDIALQVIKATGVELNQLHNDSTTIKTTGDMPGTSATGLKFKHGASKDHRPDLKQIVYNLTVSADGAIPLHYKTYPGNRTDDTLHIEIWNTLRELIGQNNFLYVADCKVCTQKQLTHIVKHGGRVVTIMPKTWKEAAQFYQSQKEKAKGKKRILRRLIPNTEKYETFYRINGTYLTEGGYYLHWIYSSEKNKRDKEARKKLLKKSELALTELMGKINTRNLKTREQIQQCVKETLDQLSTGPFYHIEIGEVIEQYQQQVGRGRPAENTEYKTIKETCYTLSWTRNRTMLEQESRIDGIFPLLCTDEVMTAKEALEAYKYQPRLEKRFYQLKSVLSAAPTLFKKVERVEAMMLLFYLALILQAVIERKTRQKMGEQEIPALFIYPEERPASHPTTDKIFDRFRDVSSYQIIQDKKVLKEYFDDLTDIQKEVLNLLDMTEKDYWLGVV